MTRDREPRHLDRPGRSSLCGKDLCLGRWFIWLVGVFLLAYRPGFWYPEDIEFLSIPVLLGMLNGVVHHRLLTNRPVTWRWMLFLSAAEIALITVGVVIGGGFRSFIFLSCYPSLAVFAVVFSSHWLSLAWTTASGRRSISPRWSSNSTARSSIASDSWPRSRSRAGQTGCNYWASGGRHAMSTRHRALAISVLPVVGLTLGEGLG